MTAQNCGKPVDNKAKPALRAFMQHITQALKTKLSPLRLHDAATTAHRIHGQVRGYLEDYPDETAELADYFDFAPRAWPPERYVAYMRSRIKELRHLKLKPARPVTQHHEPQPIGAILHELSS